MNNQIKSIVLTIIALILIFASYQIGFNFGKNKGLIQGKEIGEQESSVKITELNKTLDSFFPPLPDKIFSISGTIKSINNNIISLEAVSLTERTLPGVEPKKEIRKITVSKDAKITKFNSLILPEIDPKTGEIKPPKQEIIKLSDLKAGDNISATAKENIKTKIEFEAIEITLQVFPEAPILPPAVPPSAQ